jgi:transglutaminase-like putative cysteine protease
MRTLVFFLLTWVSIQCYPQKLHYKFEDIPKELLKNAHLVVRKKEYKFIITDISKAVLEVKLVFTVLNDNGINDSKIAIEYGKFTKVRGFKRTIYNEFGEKVKIPSISKVLDYSAISGFSLYEDNRVKYFDPHQKTPPFTVEYSYKIRYKGLFFYPQWQLYDDYNISIEKSRFEIVVPEDLDIRYYSSNSKAKPKIIKGENQKSYIWDTAMIKAIVEEPYSLPLSEYMPVVYTAPVDFEISGYKGNLETWQNFGDWIELLNKNKDNIPDKTKNELFELVGDIGNDYEKIKTLYQYMQNSTRYVSIQIGIGGWQPFSAETVNRLGYGDCKALSNYTKSLLNVIGIKSYYTLVSAGSDAPNLIIDFPSSQFNHAILYVPLKNDTVWLECTNQNIPFGYIGSFTDDRDVLVIDGDSSKIVHTKVYTDNENRKINNAIVNILPNGDGDAKIITKYKGVYYDDIQLNLRSDNEKRKDLIYSNLQIPDFNLINFKYEEVKTEIPEVKEWLEVELINYCKPFGDRLLLDLNLMNRIENAPRQIENRLSDIIIRRSKVEIDTIFYRIPYKYVLESIPEEISELNEFGKYYSKVELSDQNIMYIRQYEINKGTYPKEKYNELIEFYQRILQHDKVKVLLVKND